jgi:hypothetical protein
MMLASLLARPAATVTRYVYGPTDEDAVAASHLPGNRSPCLPPGIHGNIRGFCEEVSSSPSKRGRSFVDGIRTLCALTVTSVRCFGGEHHENGRSVIAWS